MNRPLETFPGESISLESTLRDVSTFLDGQMAEFIRSDPSLSPFSTEDETEAPHRIVREEITVGGEDFVGDWCCTQKEAHLSVLRAWYHAKAESDPKMVSNFNFHCDRFVAFQSGAVMGPPVMRPPMVGPPVFGPYGGSTRWECRHC